MVTSAVPLLVLDCNVLPVELGALLDPAAAAGLLLWAAELLKLELELELPQAATASTTSICGMSLNLDSRRVLRPELLHMRRGGRGAGW